MDTHQANARELIALRATLNDALTLAEVRSVNWHTVTTAATEAIARGWTGNELARWAIGDLGEHTESAGAVIVTTLRNLARHDPPREATPQPPSIRAVLADMHARNTISSEAATWAGRIREQAKRRPA